ncbi:hypothetical protein PRCB_12765 [Pantoea rodasii]|uniref:Uncharacterized protein n=1 Tax=Pantoea rodasii TaxID=1076549 RepID=A0A2M9WCG4_9GAMM|nr:hypothetical protein PRCB_12765 [Pantoea rodasii]
MVNVRDDGDVTQIFDHSFASGIIEITRYCTRIKRKTEHDHSIPLKFLVVLFFNTNNGALICTEMVFCTFLGRNFIDEAPNWCASSILVQWPTHLRARHSAIFTIVIKLAQNSL